MKIISVSSFIYSVIYLSEDNCNLAWCLILDNFLKTHNIQHRNKSGWGQGF